MNMQTRFPKFFATLTAAMDGDADQAAQILLEIEQAGIKLAENDCVSLGTLFRWQDSPQGREWWDMMDNKAEQVLGKDYRKADFENCDCPNCKVVVELGGTLNAILVVSQCNGMAPMLPIEDLRGFVAELDAIDAEEAAKQTIN